MLPRIVGTLAAVVLVGLGTLHCYWLAGGRWATAATIPKRGGEPLLTPGPATFSTQPSRWEVSMSSLDASGCRQHQLGCSPLYCRPLPLSEDRDRGVITPSRDRPLRRGTGLDEYYRSAASASRASATSRSMTCPTVDTSLHHATLCPAPSYINGSISCSITPVSSSPMSTC